ncbi:hypothetical protein PR048_017547 [Dryococelus australis]|uniref:Uncharacterized protein n=1 Tax=Dryococelus australis TaxID=614101 RepID=A0ABQ9H9V8_9NEOP|nr:hypothetical protein PR048_017547 [Dryococelus australis]
MKLCFIMLDVYFNSIARFHPYAMLLTSIRGSIAAAVVRETLGGSFLLPWRRINDLKVAEVLLPRSEGGLPGSRGQVTLRRVGPGLGGGGVAVRHRDIDWLAGTGESRGCCGDRASTWQPQRCALLAPVRREGKNQPAACNYAFSSLLFTLCGGGRSGLMVRLLASHQGELGLIPGGVAPGFSRVGIVSDDAAGRRVFSGMSCSPALVFLRCSILVSLRFIFIGSQEFDKSRLNIFSLTNGIPTLADIMEKHYTFTDLVDLSAGDFGRRARVSSRALFSGRTLEVSASTAAGLDATPAVSQVLCRVRLPATCSDAQATSGSRRKMAHTSFGLHRSPTSSSPCGCSPRWSTGKVSSLEVGNLD